MDRCKLDDVGCTQRHARTNALFLGESYTIIIIWRIPCLTFLEESISQQKGMERTSKILFLINTQTQTFFSFTTTTCFIHSVLSSHSYSYLLLLHPRLSLLYSSSSYFCTRMPHEKKCKLCFFGMPDF